MLARAGSGLALVATLATALLLAAPARATIHPPPGFQVVTLAGDLGAFGSNTVDAAWAPDGRIFVADRSGVVGVHNPGDPPNVNHELLDISDHVNAASDNQRGLLGIATDTNFASNGYLYLLYTYDEDGSDSDANKVSTLTRVTVHPDNSVDGGASDPTETIVLGHARSVQTGDDGACGPPDNTVDCIPSEGTSHTVGTVRSAPDGTLYLGTGDGSNYLIIDPLGLNDDNPATYRGKIMHIDRNGHGLPGHPFCPADTNLTHVCTKIYAEGLRNPFRFTLMPGGGLAIGDVGQTDWEEMDLATGGEDFGWPCYEGAGPDPFEVSGQTYGDFPHCQAKYASNATKAPAFAFPHNYTGCDGLLPTGNTVIAGPVYEGDQYPAGYRGQMIFGDVGDIGIPGCGWIARANIKNGALSDYQLFATGWPSGVDLETAPDGNLAFVSLTNHTVSEIRYGPGNHPPAANPSASPDAKPLTVDFQANASDPDGDAVYYDWDFGDGSAHGIGPAPIHTYSSPGTRKVTVTVDDHRGMTSSATVAATAKPAPVKLRIRSLRLKRGAAVLAGKAQVAGSFSSTERVSKVNVSVWRGRANSKRCAWWSARRHALRRGSCKAPHWLHARLHRKGHAYAWSLALHAPLGRGSYTIVVQAIPHSSEFLPSARLHERLRVRGKRR